MINQTNEVLKSFEGISSSIIELETSSRAFALGKNEIFARICRDYVLDIGNKIAICKHLILENPSQQHRMIELEYLVNIKINHQLSLLETEKQFNIADEKTGLLRGKQLMDSIKVVLQKMKEEENSILSKRVAANYSATRLSLYINLVGGLVSFSLFCILLLRINKDLRFRKIAEDKARLNESRYHNLIQNAGAVMFTSDIYGNFTFVSSKCLELTGFTEQELLGKSYTILIPESWHSAVTNHYTYQVEHDILETSIEFPITTSTNECKWIEQIAVLQKNGDHMTGFQCIVKEITDRKKMMMELETSESKLKEYQYRLQSLLDHTTSIIFMKDLQGRYLLANKRFKEHLQVTDEQLIGKTDFEIIDPALAEKYKKLDDHIIHTGLPLEYEETTEFNGIQHNFLVVKFPLLDDESRVFGISCIASDITERSRYEQELIESRKLAENAEKLQEQFLANMSHEIRTPMNGIHGMVNLLTETNLSEEQKEFVHIIKRSSNNLLVIINDVLDFSKIKAGKLNIEQIEFNLSEIIENTWAVFKHRLAKKQLDFIVDVDPKIPGWLKGDPHRLSQVLINLIGNAIKFTEKGNIQLSITLKSNQKGQVLLEFNVTDTGIGISSAQIDHIFESFTQASDDISRKFGGTGLGLAICKQLVELQGGQIRVASTVGEGTTFVFQLPYLEVEKTIDPNTVFSLSEKFIAHELKGKHFLVVEDNLINQKVLYFNLKKAGIVTDLANNGREAIAKLQAENKYDLIIMDLQMPEMDGYQTTAFIRNVLKLQTPIIAMTATVLKGENDRCLQVGMNDYLSKPFMPADLFKSIRGLLNKPAIENQAVEFKHDQELFNLSTLEELDDEEYLLEILDMFLADTPVYFDELKEAIIQQDWERVNRQAHKLKSGVGLIQSFTLLDMLTTIESHAKKDTGKIEGLVINAFEHYELVSNGLEIERKNLRSALKVAD